MKYSYKKQVSLPFDQAEQKTREALAEAGFGIITEINVRETLKKKLDVDFEPAVILGACRPASAYQVLQSDRELGLLLPCNVFVYQEAGQVFVSTLLPQALLTTLGSDASLTKMIQEVEEKLKMVVDHVASITSSIQ